MIWLGSITLARIASRLLRPLPISSGPTFCPPPWKVWQVAQEVVKSILPMREIRLAFEAGLLLGGDEGLHVVRRFLPRAEHLEGVIADGFLSLLVASDRRTGIGKPTALIFSGADGIEHGMRPLLRGRRAPQRGELDAEILGGGQRDQRGREFIATQSADARMASMTPAGVVRCCAGQQLHRALARPCRVFTLRRVCRAAMRSCEGVGGIGTAQRQFVDGSVIAPQHGEVLRVLAHVRVLTAHAMRRAAWRRPRWA